MFRVSFPFFSHHLPARHIFIFGAHREGAVNISSLWPTPTPYAVLPIIPTPTTTASAFSDHEHSQPDRRSRFSISRRTHTSPTSSVLPIAPSSCPPTPSVVTYPYRSRYLRSHRSSAHLIRSRPTARPHIFPCRYCYPRYSIAIPPPISPDFTISARDLLVTFAQIPSPVAPIL